ncbi:MAG: histone H1 [Desulfomonilia bacterium]|jgi:hypothetical protein
MPKRKDENQIAFDALQQIIRRDAERDGIPQEPAPKPEKLDYRVKAGRRGGLRSGKARKKKLLPEQRKEIALKAARARWDKNNNQ